MEFWKRGVFFFLLFFQEKSTVCKLHTGSLLPRHMDIKSMSIPKRKIMRAIWRADYFKSEMWVSSWGVQAAVGVYFGAWREWLGHTPKSVTVNNETTYENGLFGCYGRGCAKTVCVVYTGNPNWQSGLYRANCESAYGFASIPLVWISILSRALNTKRR